MAEVFVGLLRGINVGKAKRIAMAELRALVEGLGHTEVRTLLNSGNVVFKARGGGEGTHAKALSVAVEKRFGFPVPVVVVSARELAAVIKANPTEPTDTSHFLVAFAAEPATIAQAKPLLKQSWAPETLMLGTRAAYFTCVPGVADSEVLKALEKATRSAITARNWATVMKLQVLVTQ